MRFRFVLPLLQIAATLLVLWLPWAPGAHELNANLNVGGNKTWVLVTPAAIDWSDGMNLPAMTIVKPVLGTIQGKLLGRYAATEFFAFSLVGLFCWYLLGRFADDIAQWGRDKALPHLGGGDLAFALLLAPSAALPACAFLFESGAGSVLAAWSLAWLVIASATLLFRVAQSIRQWHKPPVA
jgi:hypothetical protein